MQITFFAKACASDEELACNRKYALGLGFPVLDLSEAKGDSLAIVGGGSSIDNHVGDLHDWPGDVWAINGAWKWCQQRHIDAVFLTADPGVCAVDLAIGAHRAILATCCAPELFDSLAGSDVRVFTVEDFQPVTGPSTAILALSLSIRSGYKQITFFGCESSYTRDGQTHAYMSLPDKNWLRVKTSDGLIHLTDPPLLMQAILLAPCIREFPNVYKEESGGLLRSLIADSWWDAIEVSHSLNELLKTGGTPQ